MYYILFKPQATITIHNPTAFGNLSLSWKRAQVLLKIFPLVFRKLQLSLLTQNAFPDLSLIRSFHFWVEVIH